MPQPVILLAFANDREREAHYLRNLPAELNQLRQALSRAEDQGLCELVILPNATLDEIFKAFQRKKYRNRIAVFHYGGHAGSYELLLERTDGSAETAHAAGLVPFLAGQKGLQLVFLNGCSSTRQAEELTKNGVPAVVGTVNAVADDVATALSTRFYRALAEGTPLDQAWREATHQLKAREGARELHRYYHQSGKDEATRGMAFRAGVSTDQFPWQLYYREGAETVGNWNLPAAAEDPYFGLPAIPGRYGVPEEPFCFLERYHPADARIFFGRGRYIRDLYHRLHSSHFAPVLLLYGQSGVGKSSLLEAGLLPRLESEYDVQMVRRDPASGLTAQLAASLGLPPSETNPSNLSAQWRRLEAESGKNGLLIILDQVEEVFTRPNESHPNELPALLGITAALFRNQGERPRGKLLLSYRKEYDPEIDQACREAGLPREKIFVDKLDRRGICEIVAGLASTQALRNRYRLDVEDSLPGLIADDLLEDKNSAVAPVLQIILTKLWKQQETNDKRSFTCDDYQQLKREGILLDDFFHQQLAALRAWEQESGQPVESSGLVLDVLNYHTTPLGTAQSRRMEELLQQYQHQADLLQALIPRLQAGYLLTGLGPERTALAHDTLAPIVQRELRDSDKPGQRALRILTGKAADYALAPDPTFIDAGDLALVEAGADGMRKWTNGERELIEKSRKRRSRQAVERKRNRRLRVWGVVLITVFAIVVSWLWWQSSRQAKVNELVSEARRMERTDATRAFDIIQTALELLPNDRNALQARHDIYSENEFYSLELTAGTDNFKRVSDVALSKDASLIAAAIGSRVILWDATGKQLGAFSHAAKVNTLRFAPDGSSLLTVSDDQTARLWDTDGRAKFVLAGHRERVKTAAFSPDGKQIITGGHSGGISLWDRQGKLQHDWQPHRDSLTTLSFVGNNQLVTAGWDHLAYLWRWDGIQMIKLDSFRHPSRPISTDYCDSKNRLAVTFRDGSVILFRMENQFQKQLEIKAHRRRINDIAFTADGHYFLTASDDYQVRLWRTNGDLIRTYKGHSDFVSAVSFDASSRYFISGGAEGKVKLWKTDSKAHQTLQLKDIGILSLGITPNGRSVLLGAGDRDPYAKIDDPDSDTLQSYPFLRWRPVEAVLDTLGRHMGGINDLDISTDGQYYLSGSRGGEAFLWEQKGARLQSFEAPFGTDTRAVAFVPGSQQIATTAEDTELTMGMVFFWDQQGQLIDTLYPRKLVNDLAFSPDTTSGQWLMAGEYGKNGFCYLIEGERLDSLTLKRQKIRSVAFSDDGKYFAVGESGKNATVYVFDSRTRRQLPFSPPARFASDNRTGGRAITGIAFSPDNRYVAAGAEGGLVKVFDVKLNGQEIMTIDNNEGADVTNIAFVPPHGRWLLVSCRDGSVKKYRNVAVQ